MHLSKLVQRVLIFTTLLISVDAHQNTKGDGNIVIKGDKNKIHVSASNKDPDTPVKWKAVHGNLSLPSNAILLERLGLIDQLRSSFESSKQDITTVVLVGIVGIGGVGKTTLARLWGKRRIGNNPSITVWEFNAETEETLQKSMRDFSVQLAQTKARAKVYRRNSKCG